MKNHHYYFYIMTNQRDTVLYSGMTNDLKRRVWQHKTKAMKGFTAKYNIDKLVYFEYFSDVNVAIRREKQVKGGSRRKKEQLIESVNPNWDDLSAKLWGIIGDGS